MNSPVQSTFRTITYIGLIVLYYYVVQFLLNLYKGVVWTIDYKDGPANTSSPIFFSILLFVFGIFLIRWVRFGEEAVVYRTQKLFSYAWFSLALTIVLSYTAFISFYSLIGDFGISLIASVTLAVFSFSIGAVISPPDTSYPMSFVKKYWFRALGIAGVLLSAFCFYYLLFVTFKNFG